MSIALELRTKRADLVKKMRTILDKVQTEKRSVNTEERSEYDKIMKEVDSLKDEIDIHERQEKIESELRSSAGRVVDPPSVDSNRTENRTTDRRDTVEYRNAYRSYLLNGWHGMGSEVRNLQADVDVQGGYLVMPTTLVKQLWIRVDDLVFFMKMSTVYDVVDAQNLGIPTLENDPADSEWTTEVVTGATDTTMSFGKRNLHPQPLTKKARVSQKFMRLAVMNPEQIVEQRLAYKFAITVEKAGLLGNGVNQPLGVFVATAKGISTGRDISTGNTTGSITFDGLINAKYALKAPYRNDPACRWLFHRDGVKQIAGLKDTQNRYLWQPSTQVGQPDTILGIGVNESEYVPNTFTTGLYVGMLANWKYYAIARPVTFSIQRLNELYAETNEVGFIGRTEVDGMPIFEDAFARVKLG